MTATAQQRAVVDALDLTPEELRDLAASLEARTSTPLVRDLAVAAMERLPAGHVYLTSLRRLACWAGDRDAAALTADDIAAWALRARDEARGRANARHGLGAQEAFVLAARAAYAAAVAAGVLRVNPASAVDLPARPVVRRTALSSDQLADLHGLLRFAGSSAPELDVLVFQLLRETACRRGGVIALRIKDVAPATRTAHLVEKYGKERWQPISAHLAERLLGWAARARCGCGRVLHRTDGGHVTNRWFDSFGQRLRRAGWAAELGVTAHWLRHTTLTDVERLAGMRVAAAYAGHSETSFGVTGTYTKVSPYELALTHERLFFTRPGEADDPSAAPRLLRRVVPAAAGPVEFSMPGGR